MYILGAPMTINMQKDLFVLGRGWDNVKNSFLFFYMFSTKSTKIAVVAQK